MRQTSACILSLFYILNLTNATLLTYFGPTFQFLNIDFEIYF